MGDQRRRLAAGAHAPQRVSVSREASNGPGNVPGPFCFVLQNTKDERDTMPQITRLCDLPEETEARVSLCVRGSDTYLRISIPLQFAPWDRAEFAWDRGVLYARVAYAPACGWPMRESGSLYRSAVVRGPLMVAVAAFLGSADFKRRCLVELGDSKMVAIHVDGSVDS